jgi:hypothetical protein
MVSASRPDRKAATSVAERRSSFQAAVDAAAGATIDGSAPVEWEFAPVGGPMGDTDTYALTAHLPTRPTCARAAPRPRC